MKECTHCGGPNAPENRVCDYCGMGFSEDTIPEGSVDPREQAKLDAEAWKEANREKELVEFNLDSTKDQNVAINLPNGQTIRINDPIEKAAALAGTVLTGSAAATLKKVGWAAADVIASNLDGDDPRFGPGSNRRPQSKRPQQPAKSSGGCLGFGCVLPAALSVIAAVVLGILLI